MKKFHYLIFILVLFPRVILSNGRFNLEEQRKPANHANYSERDRKAIEREISRSNRLNEDYETDAYLSGDLQPQKYDLEIYTQIYPKFTFEGKVLITVKCHRNTNKIILHKKNLDINENDVKIKLLDSNPPSFIRIKNHRYNSVHEHYIILLRKSLEKDKYYEIKIDYSRTPKANTTGPTNDKGYLFEKLTENSFIGEHLTNEPAESRRIVYTLMNDTGARRVFPCFDQLGMKATFKIKHTHQRNKEALSNDRKISTKPLWNPFLFIKDEFTETIPMEANSVAIVLLDFLKKEFTHSTSNTDIRIFAVALNFEKLQFNPEMYTKIFQFFLDYFVIPYPFSKLDIIGLPPFNYTPIVASYGVVYIRGDWLLSSLKQTSDSTNYKFVSAMCNAISQQWIGHTVTVSQLVDDWVHIALNIVLQTQCVIEMEPKWEHRFIEPDIINSYLTLSEWHLYLKDRLPTFLVMGFIPNNIEGYSNNMNLTKAYHLTRMIHFFLGQDIFKKSINNYLEKFKFSNSKYDDLWDTFTNTANTIQPDLLPNISVGEIMTSWINQEGIPLITVTWKHETKEISIGQRPFNIFEEENPKKYQKKCWLIPLSYTTKTESKGRINKSLREWLTCKGDLNLKIDMNEDDWFLLDLNVNASKQLFRFVLYEP